MRNVARVVAQMLSKGIGGGAFPATASMKHPAAKPATRDKRDLTIAWAEQNWPNRDFGKILIRSGKPQTPDNAEKKAAIKPVPMDSQK